MEEPVKLQLIHLTNQRSVMVQDLFYAEGDCRDLILKRHIPGRADDQAERYRPQLAISWRWESLDGLTCQRQESLHDLESGPKNFGCNESARNLNLKTRYGLISHDANYSVWLVLSEPLLEISFRPFRLIPPEAG